MDAATHNSIRELLANLAQVSLAGDARGAPPDGACVRRVANSLTRAREFLAPVLERSSDSERRALFEMLSGSVEQLRRGCCVELKTPAPDDETTAAIGARFARWLSDRIEMEQRLSVLRARAKAQEFNERRERRMPADRHGIAGLRRPLKRRVPCG